VGLTAPVLCSWIKCLINLSGSVSWLRVCGFCLFVCFVILELKLRI
jgi:hypothetical protein